MARAKQSKVDFPKSESKANHFALVSKNRPKAKQSKAKQSCSPDEGGHSPPLIWGQSKWSGNENYNADLSSKLYMQTKR